MEKNKHVFSSDINEAEGKDWPRFSMKKMEKESIKLAKKIKDSSFKPNYILAIANGGLYMAYVISKFLDVPMATIRIQRPLTNSDDSHEDIVVYAKKYRKQKPVIMDAISIKPKKSDNIVIVDDKIDTGKTIRVLMNYLKKNFKINESQMRVASMYESDDTSFSSYVNYNTPYVPPWGERATSKQKIDWEQWMSSYKELRN